MARNGSGQKLPRKLAVCTASATRAPSLRGYKGVFLCKFMAVLAVSFAFLGRSASLPAHGKAIKVVEFLWGHNLVVRQSSARALHDCIGLNARLFGKFSSFVPNARDNDINRVAPVHLLLLSRGPLAVVWPVVLFVVNALQCIAEGSRPHIGGEIGVTFPPVADANPSAAVVFPLLGVGVSTPYPHGSPDGIAWRIYLKWHDFLCFLPTSLTTSCPAMEGVY